MASALPATPAPAADASALLAGDADAAVQHVAQLLQAQLDGAAAALFGEAAAAAWTRHSGLPVAREAVRPRVGGRRRGGGPRGADLCTALAVGTFKRMQRAGRAPRPLQPEPEPAPAPAPALAPERGDLKAGSSGGGGVCGRGGSGGGGGGAVAVAAGDAVTAASGAVTFTAVSEFGFPHERCFDSAAALAEALRSRC